MITLDHLFLRDADMSAFHRKIPGGDKPHPYVLFNANLGAHVTKQTPSFQNPKYFLFRGHKAPIQYIAFSPDSSMIASGDDDGVIRLWDLKTKKFIKTLSGHEASIAGLRFSSDGTRLLSEDHFLQLKVWDVKTGECLFSRKEKIKGTWGSDRILSPDNSLLICKAKDRCVQIHDLEKDLNAHHIGMFADEILCIDLSSDGRYLAISTFLKWQTSAKKRLRAGQKRCFFSVVDFESPNLGRVHPLELRFAAI